MMPCFERILNAYPTWSKRHDNDILSLTTILKGPLEFLLFGARNTLREY